MAKVKVPVYGTVGKTIFFDPQAGERAEAAVEALAQAISEGVGGVTAHSTLQGLQTGDDHPQYAMWQAPETIQGLWNFATIPLIEGETLAEYIEDVVGGDFFDFLQDTSSVVWTYAETANELSANVPPEFVQDTVGAMLVDSTSVDFTYSDLAGTFTAATINANPTALVGLVAVNGTAATPMRSDGAPALDQGIAPTWTSSHTWTDNDEVRLGTGNDLRLYHDGTNSIIRNDTGSLNLMQAASIALQLQSGGTNVAIYPSVATGSSLSVDAANAFTADFRMRQGGLERWIFRKSGDAETGANAGSSFAIIARDDAGASLGNLMAATRATGATNWGFGANSHHSWGFDNQELRIGAGSDLRLYHDGTNSIIRNDTGELRLQFSTTVIAALETAGAFDMRQQIQRSNVISPAQITGNTDNYSPTGLSTASTLRLSTDASRNLTGIAAQPAGTELTICNVGAQDLVLVHNATSTAANQFLCPGSANFTLNANDSVRIWYDTTSARWRVIES